MTALRIADTGPSDDGYREWREGTVRELFRRLDRLVWFSPYAGWPEALSAVGVKAPACWDPSEIRDLPPWLTLADIGELLRILRPAPPKGLPAQVDEMVGIARWARQLIVEHVRREVRLQLRRLGLSSARGRRPRPVQGDYESGW